MHFVTSFSEFFSFLYLYMLEGFYKQHIVEFCIQSANLLLFTGASGVFTFNLISDTFRFKSIHLILCSLLVLHLLPPPPALFTAFFWILSKIDFSKYIKNSTPSHHPHCCCPAQPISSFLWIRLWPTDSSPCFCPSSHSPPSPPPSAH